MYRIHSSFANNQDFSVFVEGTCPFHALVIFLTTIGVDREEAQNPVFKYVSAGGASAFKVPGRPGELYFVKEWEK